MGNFQPVNYANDFLQGFGGVNDIMRQRRLDEATQTQRDTENQRAERQLNMQENTNAADMKLKGLQTQEAENKLGREQKLQQLLPALAKLDAYDADPTSVTLDDDVFKAFKTSQQEFGWIPSDISKAPAFQKAGSDLYQAAGFLKELLPSIQSNQNSNGLQITYHNIDGLPPQFQEAARQALDGYNTLAEQDAKRFGKTFQDEQGGEYQTHFIGGMMLDKSGNITPLIYATAGDGSYKYVPATADQSNKADSPLFQMPLDALQLKAAAATKTALGVQRLAAADPERASKYLNNLQTGNILDTNAARKGLVSGLYTNLGDKGVELMLTNLQKLDDKKRLSVEGARLKADMEASPVLRDPNSSAEDKRLETTKILTKYPDVAANFEKAAKAARELTPEKKAPETITAGIPGKPGFEQRYAFNQNTGNYDVPVGAPMQKHAPPVNSEDKFLVQNRRDIATRLREAMRGYNTALKGGDPDKIGAAIDLIEDLNADAKTIGVMPLNLPKRPATSDEISALQEKAVSNLKEGRSAVGKFFNTSPSAAEVEAEVKRLKNQTQPQSQPLTKIGNARLTFLEQKEATGRLNKDEAGQLSRLRQRAQVTPKAPAQNNVMDMLPPASQHNGRITRDTVTGKRYQSIGGQWQEVR